MNKTNNMKLAIKSIISTSVVSLGLVSTADAAFSSRLAGQAVYDDDLDVTWIADSHLSDGEGGLDRDPVGGNPGTTWNSSQDWITTLNSSKFLGLDNWRLPTCDSADCANSELAHLFTTGGISQTTPGLFLNLHGADFFWTGTEMASDSTRAWVQQVGSSSFDSFKGDTGSLPWPVRWGDVPSEACKVTFDLPSNQWRQISLPCDPGTNNKVSDVFANMPGTYGTDWIMYRYDEASGAYQDVGTAGILEQSKGYWIIQQSGSNATLSMPQGSTPAATTDCASSPRGCVETPLSIQAGWTMVGYPHYTQGIFGNLSLVTDDTYYPGYGTQYRPTPCAKDLPSRDGCSLREAKSYDISADKLWTYDGSKYVEIKNDSDVLKPWTAYWVGFLPRAGEFRAKGIVTPRVKATNP